MNNEALEKLKENFMKQLKINKQEHDAYALMGTYGVSPSTMMEYEKVCNKLKEINNK